MEVSGFFSGGAPVIKKYQIGEAMANSGVPVEVATAGVAGIVLVETTTALDLVGITLDAQATLVTAQQTDNSDPAREVSVVINPDILIRAKLSGGATEDTALLTGTVDTASTTGLDVNTEIDYTNFDEGSIFCFSGANTDILRRIGVGDATDATVVVAFPLDIAVGDVFLHVPYGLVSDQFVQLTTALTQLDASATVDTDNNNFRIIELDMRDSSDDGRNNSFAIITPFDHLFAAGGSI